MDEQTALVTRPFDIWEAWESVESIESVATMPLDHAEGFMRNYERSDATRGRLLRNRIEKRRLELSYPQGAVAYAAELVPALQRGDLSENVYFTALMEHPDNLSMLRESAATDRTRYANALEGLQGIGIDVGELRLKMLRDAAVRMDGEPRRKHYRFADESTLMNLPPQEWLIEGIVPEDSLVVLYGAPGVGKSFVALDFALSIAYGTQWMGREVKPGVVAYIAAEGGGAPFGQRVAAWKADRNLSSAENGRFRHGGAIQLLNAEGGMGLLEGALALPVPVRLIVVDTLHRTTVGGEENSAKDMGQFIQTLETLRTYTSATVMVLHHETKGTKGIRGSSSIEGAASTVLHLKESGELVVLSCDKQKDAAEFDDIHLTPREVSTPSGGSSMVFDLASPTVQAGGLTPLETAVLAALSDEFGGSGATNGEWKEKVQQRNGMSESAFNRARARLVEHGHVEADGSQSRPRYTVSMTGAGLLQSLQSTP